ncbi:MAG: DNA polymerase III subunit delta [Betaproteobacteria bacterium]|nr:DNA polymerase III subunit delta [Betaproteobacteria bacterium]PWB57913.1 MAG: DNA polymerase III subunit delta [Betaproteobacteria bacterium]
MKIATRQLAQHLKKGLSPLYAVHGAETLLALEAGDAIRAAARKDGCTEREVFTAEPGADWAKLGASAANLSLFASKKLLEIRIPTGKPGAEGGKALEALCASLPQDTVVLVMLPELEWQGLKTAWFAALEGAGTVVEAKAVSREELPQWLADRLAAQKQHANVETLEWMSDRVEGNLLAAKQEVEKLALLLPEGEISLASIREAVTDVSRFERDALLDAIHDADPGRIARAVDSLEAEGEPLPLLLWALTEELRLMIQLTAGERPRRFLDPDRLQRVQRTARKHDAASFDRQLLRAHRIDRMIKGVETGDAWEEILEMSLALAGRPALRPAA